MRAALRQLREVAHVHGGNRDAEEPHAHVVHPESHEEPGGPAPHDDL